LQHARPGSILRHGVSRAGQLNRAGANTNGQIAWAIARMSNVSDPPKPGTYGGYSSAEEQQRQLNRAYQLFQQRQIQQMQNSPPYGAVLTATSGFFPLGMQYGSIYTDTAVPAAATVVTETKTVPQVRRRSYWRQVRYWILLTDLAIASIWPAWAPHSGSSPTAWGLTAVFITGTVFTALCVAVDEIIG